MNTKTFDITLNELEKLAKGEIITRATKGCKINLRSAEFYDTDEDHDKNIL